MGYVLIVFSVYKLPFYKLESLVAVVTFCDIVILGHDLLILFVCYSNSLIIKEISYCVELVRKIASLGLQNGLFCVPI